MKHILTTALMSAAIACMMTGCTNGANPLSTALGGTTPTSTTGTTTTTPTTTTTGTTVTTPTTTTTATTRTSGATGTGSCTRTAPNLNDSTAVDVGASDEGRYAGQHMSLGYGSLGSETAVTDAIDGLNQADYDCFSKFYPGATSVYTAIKAGN